MLFKKNFFSFFHSFEDQIVMLAQLPTLNDEHKKSIHLLIMFVANRHLHYSIFFIAHNIYYEFSLMFRGILFG